jgi:hypothetical protein
VDHLSLTSREWTEREEGITFLINGRDLIDIIQQYGGRPGVLLSMMSQRSVGKTADAETPVWVP